jgi:hypothetical protein
MHIGPDRADMIGHCLGKRERSTYQTRDPLAERVIQPFDVTGFAALLANRLMPCRREYSRVCLPAVGIAHRTLTLDCRQGRPECTGSGRIACADCHPDNLPACTVKCQPNPLLLPFIADKRPQLVALDD